MNFVYPDIDYCYHGQRIRPLSRPALRGKAFVLEARVVESGRRIIIESDDMANFPLTH